MAVNVDNLNAQLTRLQAGETRMEAKIDELTAAVAAGAGSGAADTAAAQAAVDAAADAVRGVADKQDAKVPTT